MRAAGMSSPIRRLRFHRQRKFSRGRNRPKMTRKPLIFNNRNSLCFLKFLINRKSIKRLLMVVSLVRREYFIWFWNNMLAY